MRLPKYVVLINDTAYSTCDSIEEGKAIIEENMSECRKYHGRESTATYRVIKLGHVAVKVAPKGKKGAPTDALKGLDKYIHL